MASAHIKVDETSKGTRYTVRWRPQAGSFKEKSFDNKREAERHRDKIVRALEDGDTTEHLAGRSKTFAQVAELALGNVKKQETMDDYTRRCAFTSTR